MRTWPALDLEHITRNAVADVRLRVKLRRTAVASAEAVSRPDLIQAALLDYDIAAIEERTPDLWRVFFHSAEGRDRAAVALATEFSRLSLTPVDVADEDWAARSQASLRAIRIGNIIVTPPWDVDPAGPPRRESPLGGTRPTYELRGTRPTYEIVIQPSMGFGTGHHPTTRLCLRALQNLNLNDRSVIDVGTGSGVLAIAASVLGARRVLAIDDDPDAIHAARENISLNEGTEVETRVTDLRSFESRTPNRESRFDVVVANLTGGLLIQAATRLHDLARSGGHLVLSGFMAHEAADVLRAYCTPPRKRARLGPRTSHLAILGRAEEDEWVCVTLQSAA